MEHISTVAHLYLKGKQPKIEREAHPRIVWHAAALIYTFSTYLVGGMDQHLMLRCMMIHISMIFMSLMEGTILPMLDLVHVIHYLFHIKVFAIILQNGGMHLLGEILTSHCKQSEFTQLIFADPPTEKSCITFGMHLQEMLLKGYSESSKGALLSLHFLLNTAWQYRHTYPLHLVLFITLSIFMMWMKFMSLSMTHRILTLNTMVILLMNLLEWWRRPAQS